MAIQEINDQLELLRLKELFMSDIKIRSKMAVLLSEECAAEIPPFQEFCKLTHCIPEIATMFTHIPLYDVILTRKEIAAERKRLERMKELYNRGYSVSDISVILEREERNTLYQLNHYVLVDEPDVETEQDEELIEEDTLEVKVGDKVTHKSFGEGVVTAFDGIFMFCQFSRGTEKKFIYPDCFEKGYFI